MYMRDKRFVDGAHKLEAIVDVEPFRTLIGHSNSAIEKEKVEWWDENDDLIPVVMWRTVRVQYVIYNGMS